MTLVPELREESSNPVLIVKDLVAGYQEGIDILRGVDVSVFEREIVAILGPNGSGKSTLLKSIFGLANVRSGAIHFRSQDLTGVPVRRLVEQGLAYVPQLSNVFPFLTIQENLEMGGVLLSTTRTAEQIERVYGIFPLLGDRRKLSARLLSGGQRQMLALGRALVADPDVLLLDEPTAALAPLAADKIFGDIVRLNESGVTILLVEQNAHRALEIANRAYVFDSGRNRYEGSPGELLADRRIVDLYLGG